MHCFVAQTLCFVWDLHIYNSHIQSRVLLVTPKEIYDEFFVPTLLNFTLILFERLSAVKTLCCHICDLKGNTKSLKNCINVMLNVKEKNKAKVISSTSYNHQCTYSW